MKKPLALAVLFALVFPAALRAAEVNPANLSEGEWTEYRFERLTVERTDPDLAGESRQIKEETMKEAQALDAAMTKADPTLAPILAKRTALLAGDWWAPAEADTLTAADWQKIREAREAALAANPDLVAARKALQERKQAYDAKVDAALIKADPSLTGLVSAFSKKRAD